MKFIDNMEQEWKKGLDNNQDPYGNAIFKYAESWANLMEAAIDGGAKLIDVAEELSHKADVEGITGFMYGAAVSMLSQCWVHGETLRQWHNLDTQLGHEGEKANKTSGVLNPAIMTIDI